MTAQFATDSPTGAFKAEADAAGPGASAGLRGGSIFSGASWKALAYVLIDLPWAIVAFTVVFTCIAVGASLTIIYVGIPILMFAIMLARWAAAAQLSLATGLLDCQLASVPSRKRDRSGLWGPVVDTLTDSVAWRALAYFAIKMVLAPLAFAVGVTFYSGFGMVAYPLWRPFLPPVAGADGVMHSGASLWNGMFIDTWQSMTVFALIGVALLWCAPYVVRGFLRLDLLAMRGILLRSER